MNVSPISVASRSTTAAATKTSIQSNLSQFFKKVRKAQAPPQVQKPVPKESVFNSKNRIQSPNHIQNVDARSPSLFSTPSQNTPSPIVAVEKLYDMNDAPADTPETLIQSNYNNQNDKEKDEPNSPLLIKTQIQSKINAERYRHNAGVNGFIYAKSICKKDIAAVAKKSADKSMSKMVPDSMNASECGIDDDSLNWLLNEQDFFEISPPSSTTAHSTTVGLAKVNFRKRTNDDCVLKALNLNVNGGKSNKSIAKDFDDDSSDSSDDEHSNDANFKLTENHLSFFSPNSADENSETCATVNTSPPRQPLSLPSPPNHNVIGKSTQNIVSRMPSISTNHHHHHHRSVVGVSRTNDNTNRCMQPNQTTNTSSQMERQKNQQQSAPAKRMATTKKMTPTLALNSFSYVPPTQMQTKADTIEPKRRKLSIEYILASTGNKYGGKLGK